MKLLKFWTAIAHLQVKFSRSLQTAWGFHLLIMVLAHQLVGWFWDLSINPHFSTHQVSNEFQPLPQHAVSWCEGMLFTRLSSSYQSSFSKYNTTRRICFPIMPASIELILWKSRPCIYNRCVVQDESCACSVTIQLIKIVVTIK